MAELAPDAGQIAAYFTDSDGQFRFARWSRPIAPVIFGVADDSLPALKGAIETVVLASGHRMAEVDPELGANLMIFFLKDWDELTGVDNMDQLIPNLDTLVPRLQAAGANQYRFFRFEADNSIRAAFVLLRMDDDLSNMPATDLGIEQAIKTMLLWAPDAFSGTSALARVENAEGTVMRPDLTAILAAAYDPVLPSSSEDASLALRLAARAGQFYN